MDAATSECTMNTGHEFSTELKQGIDFSFEFVNNLLIYYNLHNLSTFRKSGLSLIWRLNVFSTTFSKQTTWCLMLDPSSSSFGHLILEMFRNFLNILISNVADILYGLSFVI